MPCRKTDIESHYRQILCFKTEWVKYWINETIIVSSSNNNWILHVSKQLIFHIIWLVIVLGREKLWVRIQERVKDSVSSVATMIMTGCCAVAMVTEFP